MIDEQIRDGDFVIVEDRKTADNGEMVIALLGGRRHAEEVLSRDRGGYDSNRRTRDAADLRPADQVQMQGVVVGVMRRS